MSILTLLAPALAIFLFLTLYPVAKTFYNSVHAKNPQQKERFVGLANFTTVLAQDGVFWISVRNTAIFSIVGTLADVAAGLLLALLLFARIPLARFWRVVWFTPVLISYVVVGVIWTWIYDYDWGVLNTLLRGVGLGSLTRSWLGDPSTALVAVLATQVWKWAGFNMIVILAALYALPGDVLAAAELDACGWFAKVRYVILPIVWPVVLNLLVLSFVGKMMIFDVVWIMTRGGPLWSTETVSTYVYKRAFDWNTFDLGYPSAIAVLWFLIILAFVVLITNLLRRSQRIEF
jgi:ABC-type sugar transport system permease subunit